MNIFTKSCATLTLAVIGILGIEAQPAQAQYRNVIRPYTGQIVQYPSVQQTFPVNPNWLVAPGVNTQQYLYNQAVQAQVYNSYPPWAYGYNPYPNPIYQQNYTSPYYGYSGYSGYPSYYSPYTQTWPYYGR